VVLILTEKNITIDGGTVIAQGGKIGAGIGGGVNGSGKNIEINNGNVTATGGQQGAGIGSGSTNLRNDAAYGENITINGGKVNAIGGRVSTTEDRPGVAIGGGSNSYGRGISIYGGTVTISGRIGSYLKDQPNNIVVAGGSLKMNSSSEQVDPFVNSAQSNVYLLSLHNQKEISSVKSTELIITCQPPFR
jgi:hypothetical protein